MFTCECGWVATNEEEDIALAQAMMSTHLRTCPGPDLEKGPRTTSGILDFIQEHGRAVGTVTPIQWATDTTIRIPHTDETGRVINRWTAQQARRIERGQDRDDYAPDDREF